VPDHPPEAVHEVALAADHARVELTPLVTVLGLALRLTVAAGCEVIGTVNACVELPPLPVQLNA
jgi:hypothetical protein